MLMVVLDLFPVGIAQLDEVLAHGLWQARSGELFQTLTWARIIGGAVFIFGGALPPVWFMVTRMASLKFPKHLWVNAMRTWPR